MGCIIVRDYMECADSGYIPREAFFITEVESEQNADNTEHILNLDLCSFGRRVDTTKDIIHKYLFVSNEVRDSGDTWPVVNASALKAELEDHLGNELNWRT